MVNLRLIRGGLEEPEESHSEIHPSLAEVSYEQMEINLGRVAVFLGQPVKSMPKKENIQVIDGVVEGSQLRDHPDGTVMGINAGRNKTVIVATNNFISFFENNVRSTNLVAIDEASLYIAAFSVGVHATTRQQMPRRFGFEDKVWQECNVAEPVAVQSYRFAAVVVNNLSKRIRPDSIINTRPITYQVASFMNPLTKSQAKEAASPYFAY